MAQTAVADVLADQHEPVRSPWTRRVRSLSGSFASGITGACARASLLPRRRAIRTSLRKRSLPSRTEPSPTTRTGGTSRQSARCACHRRSSISSSSKLERLTTEELDLFSAGVRPWTDVYVDLLLKLSGFDEDGLIAPFLSPAFATRFSARRSRWRMIPSAFITRRCSVFSTIGSVAVVGALYTDARRDCSRRSGVALRSSRFTTCEARNTRAHCPRRRRGRGGDERYSTDEALRFFRWAVESERAMTAAGRTASSVLGPERAVAFHVDYGCSVALVRLDGRSSGRARVRSRAVGGAGLRTLSARARTALADLHRLQGSYDAAIGSARAALDALAYDDGVEAERERSAAHLVLGDVFYRKGALPAAATEFRAGLEAARAAVIERPKARRRDDLDSPTTNAVDSRRRNRRCCALSRSAAKRAIDRAREGRSTRSRTCMRHEVSSAARSPTFSKRSRQSAEAGSREDKGIVLCNLGEVLRKQRPARAGARRIRQALSSRESSATAVPRRYLLEHRLVHTEREQFSRALERLEQSTALLKEIGDNDVLGEALLGIAVVHQEM